MNLIKKIASPVIYTLFLIVVGISGLLTAIMVEEIFGLNFIIIFVGFPEGILGIVAIGIPLFWLGNKLMLGIERMDKPKLSDHLRQASMNYIALIYSIFYITNSEDGSKGKGVLIMFFCACLLGILINALFLYHNAKKAQHSKLSRGKSN